jgi:hypothetical protein
MSESWRTALPGLLSPRDVQVLFNRSARTIRRWVKQDKLDPVCIGRAVYFRESDIRRLIEAELQVAVDADGTRYAEVG